MTRHARLATLIAALPVPAVAHPGHIAEAAGHDHWLAGATIAAAAAVALWAAIKSRKKDDAPETEDDAAEAEGEDDARQEA